MAIQTIQGFGVLGSFVILGSVERRQGTKYYILMLASFLKVRRSVRKPWKTLFSIIPHPRWNRLRVLPEQSCLLPPASYVADRDMTIVREYVSLRFFKIQKTWLFTFFEVSCQKTLKNVESLNQVSCTQIRLPVSDDYKIGYFPKCRLLGAL